MGRKTTHVVVFRPINIRMLGVVSGHDHSGGGHSHGFGAHALEARREDSRRRLVVALAINVVLLFAEAIGGVLTGSLAVLADAGHLLSDVGSIVLALIAARLAARPASNRRTFGYQRSEVLAALVNGLLLVAVSVGVGIAAIGRLSNPPGIEGGGVLALGLLGLAGNAAATVYLARGERADINLEGVIRHSFADALGSLGVVLAGAWVLLGGSDIVDPIVGLLISALVLISSWRLLKEPFDVLMEAAPADLDVDRMGAAICRVEGVRSVHDLHVWTVTAGFPALSAHVVVARGADRDLVLRRLEMELGESFGIEHTTLQVEEEAEGGLLRIETTPPADQPSR
jgi:cobalt-zinc-cadmium efflux system protein